MAFRSKGIPLVLSRLHRHRISVVSKKKVAVTPLDLVGLPTISKKSVPDVEHNMDMKIGRRKLLGAGIASVGTAVAGQPKPPLEEHGDGSVPQLLFSRMTEALQRAEHALSFSHGHVVHDGKLQHSYVLDNSKELRFIDKTLQMTGVRTKPLEPLPGRDLQATMRALYDSEINVSLTWLWDGGVDFALISRMDPVFESLADPAWKNVRGVNDLADALHATALEEFPTSTYAKGVRERETGAALSF